MRYAPHPDALPAVHRAAVALQEKAPLPLSSGISREDSALLQYSIPSKPSHLLHLHTFYTFTPPPSLHLTDRLTATLLRSTPPFVEALASIGIHTVEDLLLTLPRGYEDLSAMRTLDQVEEGEKVTVRGIVSDVKVVRTRNGKVFSRGIFTDADWNACEVIWFNQPHIKRMIPEETELVLTGKIGWTRNKLTLQSPTFERGDRGTLLHAGKLIPMYPERQVTGNSPTLHDINVISTRWLREKMVILRNAIKEFPETLPEEVLKEENFPTRDEMIEELHFPTSGEAVDRARSRIAFEELYALH